MKILKFSELGDNPRQDLKGARWLLLHHSELSKATSILIFTELDGILVGIDHRGKEITDGVWQRAVHLLLIDESLQNPLEIQRKTGITKVIQDNKNRLQHHCW
jgi:hypothetical protein